MNSYCKIARHTTPCRHITTCTGTVLVLLTHPDRNTQNERKATQSNAKQRTQGKQHQSHKYNTSSKSKTENRSSRAQIETTDNQKKNRNASRSPRNHQPKATSTAPPKPTKPSKGHDTQPQTGSLSDAIHVQLHVLH